jgi:hypothetical protein
MLAGCGGGGGSSNTISTAPAAKLAAACGNPSNASSSTGVPGATGLADNVLAVSVDGGPSGAAYLANRLYATVTVCKPGTQICQTLDHVLVDTGSTGLRVLASELSTAVDLPRTTNESGLPLLNCAQFLDGSFMWGPVATADVYLGNKVAQNIPIQIAGNTASPTSCSASGTQITTATGSSASALDAKGILGIGNYKEDCGSFCAASPSAGYYFSGSDSSCSSVSGSRASIAKQVKNPVPLFAADNNGLVVVLPAVSGNSTSTLSGSILFGIGTRTNNQPGSATRLQLQSSGYIGYITTTVAGISMPKSFLDTGSNGLFFDTSLSKCRRADGFYCPSSATPFSAVLIGSDGQFKAESFSVNNAESVFQYGEHVFPGLAGPLNDSRSFDWGLPFFFGKSVFIGIEGSSSSLGSGTYYAF